MLVLADNVASANIIVNSRGRADRAENAGFPPRTRPLRPRRGPRPLGGARVREGVVQRSRGRVPAAPIRTQQSRQCADQHEIEQRDPDHAARRCRNDVGGSERRKTETR